MKKNLVVARKSNFIRTGQEVKCVFYAFQLIKPSEIYTFMAKDLLLWCKADLHIDEPHTFNVDKFIAESSEEGRGEHEKVYIKASPLDFWLENLEIPEAKPDFS